MPFGNVVQQRTPSLIAGRLRHKIQIVKGTGAQDSTGGFSLADTELVAEVWASVDALNGSEQFAAGQQMSTVTHSVVMRYRAGITAAQQVRWGARKFQITAPLNPDGRKKMLQLLCVEVNSSVNQ